MAHQSPTRLPEPRPNARIEVQVTGEGIGGTLQHREAGPTDARALFTQGLNDCRAIATYTPGPSGARRTLVHVNGGYITNEYITELAGIVVPGQTSVIFANGVVGSEGGFDRELADFQKRLNKALGNRGRVEVQRCWTEGMYAGMFCLMADGTYGRCNPASLSSSSGVSGGKKKRWYFCFIC